MFDYHFRAALLAVLAAGTTCSCGGQVDRPGSDVGGGCPGGGACPSAGGASLTGGAGTGGAPQVAGGSGTLAGAPGAGGPNAGGAPGECCDSSSDCQAGEECAEGACLPAGNVPGSCWRDGDCSAGLGCLGAKICHCTETSCAGESAPGACVSCTPGGPCDGAGQCTYGFSGDSCCAPVTLTCADGHWTDSAPCVPPMGVCPSELPREGEPCGCPASCEYEVGPGCPLAPSDVSFACDGTEWSREPPGGCTVQPCSAAMPCGDGRTCVFGLPSLPSGAGACVDTACEPDAVQWCPCAAAWCQGAECIEAGTNSVRCE